MKRDSIPRIDMVSYGENRLLQEGFVAIPLDLSMSHDPSRSSPHYHDFFQVSLLLGSGSLMHDFRETTVSGVTLFFLSPGQVHTVNRNPGMGGTIVSFTRDFFETGSGPTSGILLELPFFYATEVMPWLPLGEAEGKPATRLFQEMQQEFDEGREGAAEILRSLLRILMVRASRWYAGEASVADASRATVLVRRFQQEVEQHHHEWSLLEPYARVLGVTVNHLNDVFREETGTSAGEHIRQRRLLDAKRLLLHSSLSVAEICFRLGFKDPSYFGRFFRRYEEISPAEFRVKIREKYQKGLH